MSIGGAIAGLPRGARFALAALAVWSVFAWAFTLFMDRAGKDDKECFAGGFQAPVDNPPPELIVDLGVTQEILGLNFGQGRGVERDQVRIDAAAEVPRDLEVESSALTGDQGTIDGDDVVVRARTLRNTILLDACIDARRADGIDAGTYSGIVVFTDPRVSALSVPVTMTVQGRLLWLLSPLTLIFPGLALFLVWASVARGQRNPRATLTILITSFGATVAVFGAQGVNNPSWGGILAAAALIASMYTAATGVSATLGAAQPRE